MDLISLSRLGDELLAKAAESPQGRSAYTVVGGRTCTLRALEDSVVVLTVAKALD